jgi:putative heme-binding domain-containing protein
VYRKISAACHRLGGEGHAVAPDFNTVKDRSPESILTHLVDPNREVAPPYVAYSARTSDGRVVTGIISSETSAAITLRRAEGVEEQLLRSQVAAIESSGLSLMPEGLEKDLADQELADLIAAVREGL